MSRLKTITRCRGCGKMRVRGAWYEHGLEPETDGMPIVDGFCHACFAEVMGAVVHVGQGIAPMRQTQQVA